MALGVFFEASVSSVSSAVYFPRFLVFERVIPYCVARTCFPLLRGKGGQSWRGGRWRSDDAWVDDDPPFHRLFIQRRRKAKDINHASDTIGIFWT